MQSKIEQTIDSLETTSIKSVSSKKIAYSNYFEVRLNKEDFGKDRKKHNQICNQVLLKHLEALNQEGIQLCDWVSNGRRKARLEYCLIKRTRRKKWRGLGP